MRRFILVLGLGVILVANACEKKREEPAAPATSASAPASASALPESAEVDDSLLASFKPPLPAVFESKDNPLTEDKITLGRALYYETRLSASNKISCDTCHDLAKDGADGRKASIGHKDQEGRRNAPTVYNAAGHFVQFWDGRAKDVEEQAKGPILNPVEMAMESDKNVVEEITKVKWYRDQFAKVFSDQKAPITIDNIARAIAAFERKLSTPSRWDKFLGGDKSALTDDEKRGFKKFVATGCTACHMGTYVGGSMYQKLGLVQPWPSDKDLGRFEHTKNDADKMMFKVPSLRNVEKTAPYFHDGSVATLDEAVRLMAKHQLGKELSPADIASIVTFLKTLTGEIPKDYIDRSKVPSEIPPPPTGKK